MSTVVDGDDGRAQAGRSMTRKQRGDDDWLPVSQAATLTGESVRLWELRAAREWEEAGSQGRWSRAVRARPPDGVGRSVWWVQRRLHNALRVGHVQEALVRRSLLACYPADYVERAYAKAELVEEWRRLCDERGAKAAGMRHLAVRIVEKHHAAHGRGFPISARSLYCWWKTYRSKAKEGRHAAIEALIGYKSLRRPCGIGIRWLPAERDPRAVGHFLKLRHAGRNLSLRSCHRATRTKAVRKGWRWAGSYEATRRWWRAYRAERSQETQATHV